MKTPYIYAMPEEFMLDQSVPAHWRLLGLLNGFFFNGKGVYASNAWLAEQLGCSPRTITDAVSKLETLEKIHCIRTKVSRIINKKDSNQLLPPSQPTAISDSDELLPISNSNSDSIKTDSLRSSDSSSLEKLFQAQPATEDSAPAKKPKDAQLAKASAYWTKLCLAEAGSVSVESPFKAQAIIKEARKALTYPQIKDMMDAWFQEQTLAPHEMIQITRCLSAKQIDRYLAENV